jgi:glycosyltransferase involved in cell wall biosynthesis
VPYDEDYGFITIEAMMSGKPVLTLTDAGGPNEFVKNGETGFSVPPDPKAIAERIDYLCMHRDHARQMGRTAREVVSSIRWEGVVQELLSDSVVGSSRSKSSQTAYRKKMVVAVTFPIYPPRGGGQARVYHLYRYLVEYFDIEIYSLCADEQPVLNQEIAPGLREVRVPISQAHQSAESKISETVNWVPVTDIAAPQLIHLTPDYLEHLQDGVRDADIVVACHPYLGNILSELAPKADFWYEAQDVEFEVKMSILPDNKWGKSLLDTVRTLESYCWQRASTVFSCTKRDIDTLQELYGTTSAKTVEVPNGVSIEAVPFVDGQERHRRKKMLGIEGYTVGLFMGSWHGPNIVAADHVLSFARHQPDFMFFIVGSVCDAILDRIIPNNVKLLGIVDDETKATLLGTADVALNPMTSGSGSNLKMLDYFAAGIPVISTDFGVRGIRAESGVHYISSEIYEFTDAIENLQNLPHERIAKQARQLAENDYSWKVIAKRFIEFLGTGNGT